MLPFSHTHSQSHTHTQTPLETITKPAFKRQDQRTPRESKALKRLIFHHNLTLPLPQSQIGFTQVLPAKRLVF